MVSSPCHVNLDNNFFLAWWNADTFKVISRKHKQEIGND